ncbi:MAG: M20/M25/M40 family metallo-hydrolase, partial [Clostridiales bacterium]|nr:M20/M25/M40 family metallo-hydrolase [Clostridiales bacterium]
GSSVPENGVVVFSAHIDTVFQDIWEINPVIKEGKIYAPSILDNSINVAGQMYCIKILNDLNLEIKKPTLFVFDVGEEGLGNLKGIRHAVDQWKDKIEAVIALDLGYESVVDTAVGSRRYAVTVQTEGGHSWGDFGNHSAILYASKIIDDIYNVKVPENHKTTYNVGIIKGGTTINTIAQDVEIAVDLRSIDETSLEQLYKKFMNIIDKHKSDQVRISIRTLGERPCGKTSHNSDLIKKIIETRKEFGLALNFNASSTDANYPISLGIPSVSFGVGIGKGVHTLDEYLIAESVKTGMKHLMSFVNKYIGFILP